MPQIILRNVDETFTFKNRYTQSQCIYNYINILGIAHQFWKFLILEHLYGKKNLKM